MISLDRVLNYSKQSMGNVMAAEAETGDPSFVIEIIKEIKRRGGTIEDKWVECVKIGIALNGKMDEYKKFKQEMAALSIKFTDSIGAAAMSGNVNFIKYLIDSGETIEGEKEFTLNEFRTGIMSAYGHLNKLGEVNKDRIDECMSAYSTYSPLLWSMVLSQENVFDLIVDSGLVSNGTLLAGMRSAVILKDPRYTQKLFDNKTVRDREIESAVESLASDTYCGEDINVPLISTLRDDQKKCMFDLWESDVKKIEAIMKSNHFRNLLISHLPSKYIEYAKKIKEIEPAKKNVSLAIRNEIESNISADVLAAIECESTDVLGYIMGNDAEGVRDVKILDYPKESMRLKREIGPVLYSLLNGKEKTFLFLCDIPGVFDAEKETIEMYQKNNWLLDRSEKGINRRNRLTKNAAARKDKSIALLEHKKLMLEMSKGQKQVVKKSRLTI
jgi:hypothetical protein